MRALDLKIPPVAVVLIAGALMWLSSRIAPTLGFVIPMRDFIAVAIALLGATTSILGVVSFRHAGTTVNPLTPTASSSLVRSGVYTVSRNPMYLGFAILLPVSAETRNNPAGSEGEGLSIAFDSFLRRY
jgi:protein-S-isoprenylcysteine O-methyltransferase Ste14